MVNLRRLSKFEGELDDLIEDYCSLFHNKYKYSIRYQINNIFTDLHDSRKEGFVLLDDGDPVGIIIYHVDHSVGVIHFFHLKQRYAQITAFKTIFQHTLKKIKQNLPKIVFLTEIFNFGPKQRRTLMAQFDFEEKHRDLYHLDIHRYRQNREPQEGLDFKGVEYENLEKLSEITYFSFAGSMELEVYPVGFERDDFVQQLQNTINGLYGRFLPDYSMEIYHEEELVGMILSVSGGEGIELHQFLLAPRSWGKGYGYAMLDKFIQIIRDRKEFFSVTTMISHDNLKVRRLLENMGFKKMVEIPVFTRILK